MPAAPRASTGSADRPPAQMSTASSPSCSRELADGRLERRVVAHKRRRSSLGRELHCRAVDVDPDAVAARGEKDPERKLTDEAEADHSDALTHDCFALAHAVKRDCADRCVCSSSKVTPSGMRATSVFGTATISAWFAHPPPPQATRSPGTMPSTPRPTASTIPGR